MLTMLLRLIHSTTIQRMVDVSNLEINVKQFKLQATELNLRCHLPKPANYAGSSTDSRCSLASYFCHCTCKFKDIFVLRQKCENNVCLNQKKKVIDTEKSFILGSLDLLSVKND